MPDTLLFTAGVTLPVCIMLLAGILLKKTGYIDDHFISVSSRLVFNFGFPAVLFFTLPLALLGVGGTLSLKALGKTSHVSFLDSLAKVALLPLIVVPVAMLLGYEAMELGVLFLMMSCPTAAASFIMAKASGSNGELAANIIVLTTLASLPAVSLGLFVMRTWGVI